MGYPILTDVIFADLTTDNYTEQQIQYILELRATPGLDPEQDTLKKELERLFSESQLSSKSNAFNVLPGSGQRYPAGVGSSNNRGVGVALLIKPKLSSKYYEFERLGPATDTGSEETVIGAYEPNPETPYTNGGTDYGVDLTVKYPAAGSHYVAEAQDPGLQYENDKIVGLRRMLGASGGPGLRSTARHESRSYLVYMHYDYSQFSDWHEDKECVTTTPSVHQGLSLTTKNLTVENTFFRNSNDPMYKNTTIDDMTDYFFVFDQAGYGVEALRRFWLRDLELAKYNTNYLIHLGATVEPFLGFGPLYSLVAGEDIINDTYSKYKSLDSGVNTEVFFSNRKLNSIRESARDMLLVPSYNSRQLMVHSLDAKPTEAEGPRELLFDAKSVFISDHEVLREGSAKFESAKNTFLRTSASVPRDNLTELRRSNIDLDYNHALRPFVIKMKKSIIDINAFNDELYVGTDSRVFRIPILNIGATNYNVLRVSDRGTDSPLKSESTVTFCAKGNFIYSIKYYEEARGYQGHPETKYYPVSNISEIELMVTNHNIAVFGDKSEKLYILSLGETRKTNGLSLFTFADTIEKYKKLDDDRLLLFFRSQPAAIVNFNEAGSYLDDIHSNVLSGKLSRSNQRYTSIASSLPLIEFTDENFAGYQNTVINQALVSIGGTAGEFELVISDPTDNRREIDVQVAMTANDFSLENIVKPVIIKAIPPNGYQNPVVSIRTDSDKNLSFSDILLGGKIG